MADDKIKSEDMVPQADKQAHTEIAEREGRQGEQARVINKEGNCPGSRESWMSGARDVVVLGFGGAV